MVKFFSLLKSMVEYVKIKNDIQPSFM